MYIKKSVCLFLSLPFTLFLFVHLFAHLSFSSLFFCMSICLVLLQSVPVSLFASHTATLHLAAMFWSRLGLCSTTNASTA